MAIVVSPKFSREKVLKSVSDIGVHPSLTSDGAISINGYELPYVQYKWAFERFGFVPRDVPINGSYIPYELWIDGQKHNCYAYSNGSVEFYVGEKLHCNVGPAKVTSEGRCFHFQRGQLSRLDGPASYGYGNSEIYAIDGKIYDFKGFVENHPKTKATHIYHMNRVVSIFNNKDDILLKSAGHEVLLKKRSGLVSTPRHFLLYALYRQMGDCDIVEWETSDPEFSRILNLLDSNYIDFSENQTTTHSEMEVIFEDFSSMYLHTNKADDKVGYEIFNSDGVSVELGTLYVDGGALHSELNSVEEKGLSLEDEMKKENTDKRVADLLESLGGVYESSPKSESKKAYNLHDVSVSRDNYLKAIYDPLSDMYYWVDTKGKYHSPEGFDLPAKIYPDGRKEHYKHGVLHREAGPAVYDSHYDVYCLHGRECSYEEFIRYERNSKCIRFEEDGVLHRMDGPALIWFDDNGNAHEEYFYEGKQITPIKEGLDDLFAPKTTPHLKELNRKLFARLDEIEREEAELEKKREQKLSEWAETQERKKMDKIKRGGPDLSGGRLSQLAEGGVYGLKKGTVNGGADLIANKVAEMASFDDKNWAKEVVKLALISGSAEMLSLVPEEAAEKVGLGYDAHMETVGFLRKVAGENIGRNAVNVLTGLYPYFKEVLSNFTVEDFNAVADDYESNAAALDPAAQYVDLEDMLRQEQDKEQFVESEEAQEVENVKER